MFLRIRHVAAVVRGGFFGLLLLLLSSSSSSSSWAWSPSASSASLSQRTTPSLSSSSSSSSAFGNLWTSPSSRRCRSSGSTHVLFSSSSNNDNSESDPASPTSAATTAKKKKKPLYPQPGDLVRYYDLDGGQADGQVLVGRIRFLSKASSASSESGWTVELTPLEDIGEGYFAEYSTSSRWRQKEPYRDLADVSPLSASFVRSVAAYKVPRKKIDDTTDWQLLVRAPRYDYDDGLYLGPASTQREVDRAVVEADAVAYQGFKDQWRKYVVITALAATLLVQTTRGWETALDYLAGASASLLYVTLLAWKTETVGPSSNNNNDDDGTVGALTRIKSRLANARFFLPVLVLTALALYNAQLGDANPLLLDDNNNIQESNPLRTVTAEQFVAAMAGFLTYRLPLLAWQLQQLLPAQQNSDAAVALPGSAGIALQFLKESQQQQTSATNTDDQPTVLLVSGPTATGRAELIQQLLLDDNDDNNDSTRQFVAPTWLDRYQQDGATWERWEQRDELLWQNAASKRFGLTATDLQQQALAATAQNPNTVLVLEADVPLTKQVVRVSGLRVVGVWVGLPTVAEFETRLSDTWETLDDDNNDDDSLVDDDPSLSDEERRNRWMRARTQEIVKDIEYGVTSGVFEFTILNTDPTKSLQELRAAAEYCFNK